MILIAGADCEPFGFASLFFQIFISYYYFVKIMIIVGCVPETASIDKVLISPSLWGETDVIEVLTCIGRKFAQMCKNCIMFQINLELF